VRLIAFQSSGVFWGALWACLTDAVLVAAALVCWANAALPPQDLPWKPLALSAPPGLATRQQLQHAAADPARCRAALRAGGVKFDESPPRREAGCSQLDAIRLRGGTTPLSPAAPVMTCGQTLTYAAWDRYGLQPAARELLGQPLASVDHMGTYACRNMYGAADGPRSEHAFANALDVGGYTTAGGRKLRVLGQFDGDDRRGAFLRRSRDEACRWFRTTLSPDYNPAHRDHLHLDSGRYRVCR
jgi:hypothetical protein